MEKYTWTEKVPQSRRNCSFTGKCIKHVIYHITRKHTLRNNLIGSNKDGKLYRITVLINHTYYIPYKALQKSFIVLFHILSHNSHTLQCI